MKPIGPLMVEHRLIERMIALMDREVNLINAKNVVNIDFLYAAVDFSRTYSDRTHHGKEEDILFRELARKNLSPEHKRIMEELVQEHVSARKMVTGLAEAGKAYRKESPKSIKLVLACFRDLIKFYPIHIEKEDKRFFFPILDYFGKKEQDDMLQEFWDFDRKMIHEKYQKSVESLEKQL